MGGPGGCAERCFVEWLFCTAVSPTCKTTAVCRILATDHYRNYQGDKVKDSKTGRVVFPHIPLALALIVSPNIKRGGPRPDKDSESMFIIRG